MKSSQLILPPFIPVSSQTTAPCWNGHTPSFRQRAKDAQAFSKCSSVGIHVVPMENTVTLLRWVAFSFITATRAYMPSRQTNKWTSTTRTEPEMRFSVVVSACKRSGGAVPELNFAQRYIAMVYACLTCWHSYGRVFLFTGFYGGRWIVWWKSASHKRKTQREM